MQPPRVIVLGDEPLLARGAALLLDQSRDVEATYVESPARARRVAASGRTAAVAWVGAHLDAGAIAELRELRAGQPDAALCLVARRADAVALEGLVAESAERLAFVLYDSGVDAPDLVELVRAAVRGRSTVDPALLERLTSRPPSAADLRLTAAEREIMDLVAIGLRNREIGRRLWKSEKAVEKHVGRLFGKLGLPAESGGHLDRRVAATRVYLALQNRSEDGLLEPDRVFQVPDPEPASSG